MYLILILINCWRTIRILFVFCKIIVLVIRIQPNSQDSLFGTALVLAHTHLSQLRCVDRVAT